MSFILSDAIGLYIKLTKKGDLFWARCPFHEEKTPSFVVNNEKAFFHCFGCSEHGDLFTFVQKFKKIGFKEAAEEVSTRLNVSVKNIKQRDTKVEELLAVVTETYKANLLANLNDEKLRDFVESRRLGQAIDRFCLGYSKGDFLINNLQKQGFSLEQIERAGILVANHDRFSNRFIFPIRDRQKKTLGFGARSLDEVLPKYINSPETSFFQKSYRLYNENELVAGEPTILVEGYIDVISLCLLGFPNVVGSMGTSISPGQALSLYRVTDRIFLMLDSDRAGQKATDKTAELFLRMMPPGKSVSIVQMEDKDPDSACIKGKNYVETLLEKAIPIENWFLNKFQTIRGKNEVGIKIAPKDQAKALESIHNLVETIQNQHVRKAFHKYFSENLSGKQTKTPSFNVPQRDSMLISILIADLTLVEYFVEELANYTFKDKIFEETKEFLLEQVVEKQRPHKEIEEAVRKKISIELENINNCGNIFYIIHNRSFVFRFVKDLLSTRKRKRPYLVQAPGEDDE